MMILLGRCELEIDGLLSFVAGSVKLYALL